MLWECRACDSQAHLRLPAFEPWRGDVPARCCSSIQAADSYAAATGRRRHSCHRHILEEPIAASMAHLVRALYDDILAALQRPGLLAAACAIDPGTALHIGILIGLHAKDTGRDASAIALCAAPAAVDFVADSRNFK